MSKKRVAIIGGGITGLTAAYFIQKEIARGTMDADYALYEAGPRLGGSIQTDYTNGFVIEQGPDSFLTRKTSMSELANELGLVDDLVTNQSGAYILHDKKLHRIPEGAVMGIPTKWRPFLSTGLFSFKGKVRAALDLALPKSHHTGDQSVGAFFRRRLGDEVVDNLIEPLLSGIYAGNIDQLSLQATFPQFQQIEQKHRSLILGMKSQQATQQKIQPIFVGPDKKPANMFLTFEGGLQSIVEALGERLEHAHVNMPVTSVEKDGERYRVTFNDGTVDVVDHVIMTTRHQHTAEILSQYDFVKPLKEMTATSVATVAVAYPLSAIKKDLDGTGFVVSKKSNYTITACTWTHKKWPHTAPEGYGLLRAYVGRASDEAIVYESDEVIMEAVKRDFKDIMGIEESPSFYKIKRFEQSMPQYEVNHGNKIASVREKLKETLPGVVLAGASYNGIGLPDCVNQAKQAIDEVMDR
ncbi:protoporphyrinogen oxidase [Paenalkalicoccus suaedae]|uniref:Coproporphyrinogen III oxidase n=1 Tax=Paenalkalicoccus suaedae TaxID=2592382 RepID=A0A859FEU0_9BACI|nr:protoporphyrinogen oxidase [Paenalkalicoccus suaedae]QKS70756.1 protoporphyrinogen oxidase [Paenalkalicoccus suaedae]